jgi:RNA polymerase sigma-70 factor (sigma-E family)
LDASFDVFVLGTRRRLVHLADLLVGDRGLAEDLVQESYVRAYSVWARIHDGHPEAYTRRCLVNLSHDWRRRRSSAELPTDDLGDPAGGWEAEQVLARMSVLRSLAVLTERERQVIVLRYYAELSEAQIGHEIGCAAGTVKSTAARALKRLRTQAALDREVL